MSWSACFPGKPRPRCSPTCLKNTLKNDKASSRPPSGSIPLAGLWGSLRGSELLLRRMALGMATVFLIFGLVYSYSLHPQVIHNLRWTPIIVLSCIGVPLSVGLSAVEFSILARLNRVRVHMATALEVTVLGSAANMLPLPGATIVRVAALRAAGSPLTKGTSSTVLVGVIWIAAAFGYAGSWMLTLSTGIVAPVFLAIGMLVFVASVLWWHKLDGSFSLFAWMFLTKILLVFVDAVSIFLCFAALNTPASFAQVSGLAVAGVLGSAVSIVPAGLGIREGVSAAISPIVGLAATLGFLAVFVNRLIGMSVIVPLAVILTLRKAGPGNE